LACLDRFYTLFGLLFNSNGMQHLSELMDINPGKQYAFAFTCDAFAEKGVFPASKREDLACGENALAPTCITGSLDWYFHIAS
jgi:hypothetical protein